MNSENLPIPGGRDVRATLDAPDDEDPDAVVVACPPHPQHRGHRGDERLTAVSEALCGGGVACLRFDYGDWDEGYGEREDARNAVRWARDRYDRVGIFGYSFGGTIAVLAAATVEPQPDAVSLLAPASRLATDLDAASALDDVAGPVQVVYGSRDDTANWRRLVERARELGFATRTLDDERQRRESDHEVVEVSADHFFVGQHDTVAETASEFLVGHLG